MQGLCYLVVKADRRMVGYRLADGVGEDFASVKMVIVWEDRFGRSRDQ